MLPLRSVTAMVTAASTDSADFCTTCWTSAAVSSCAAEVDVEVVAVTGVCGAPPQLIEAIATSNAKRSARKGRPTLEAELIQVLCRKKSNSLCDQAGRSKMAICHRGRNSMTF